MMYFLDLWILRTHPIVPKDRIPVCGVAYDQSVVYALDLDEKIKIYEFGGLQSKMFFDYKDYLTSADEMNQIISGHESLTVQEAYSPLRQNETRITDSILHITTFFDPPIDIILSKDHAVYVYKKKLVFYLRAELLTLGNLKDFDRMKATRSQYHYIVWELEKAVKNIKRVVISRNEDLIVILEVCPADQTYEHFTISKADLKALFEALYYQPSINLFSQSVKVNKMVAALHLERLSGPEPADGSGRPADRRHRP